MAQNEWFKPRGYPHISNKITHEDKWLLNYVKNPKKIAEHGFLPLIHKKLPQRRFKIVGQDAKGKSIRGHKKISEDGSVKSNKKLRPIHYATHIDTHIYAYYSMLLQEKYEALLKINPDLSKCISAYRRIPTDNNQGNKNNIHFAKDVFEAIILRGSNCCAMAFDIESFFNSLNHDLLKKAWSKLLGTKSLPKDHYNVFKSITRFSYILLDDLRVSGKNSGFDEAKLAIQRRQGVHAYFSSVAEFREKVKTGQLRIYKNQYHDKSAEKTIRGIAQGLPISAMLANLYLLEFDKEVYHKVVELHKGTYRRYSDDLVVICDEKDSEEIKAFIVNKIKNLLLEISEAKTEICFFRQNTEGVLHSYMLDTKQKKEQKGKPFCYLGFEFYGNCVRIKSAKLATFYRRMKSAVKTKIKRTQQSDSKKLSNDFIIYKRQLYRTFTKQGKKPRLLPKKIVEYEKDKLTGYFIAKKKDIQKRYRGNYFNYAQRSSIILKDIGGKAITLQVRKHERILLDYLDSRIEKL